MKEYRGPEDFQGLFTALKKAVMERALNAELSTHLGYEKGQEKPGGVQPSQWLKRQDGAGRVGGGEAGDSPRSRWHV